MNDVQEAARPMNTEPRDPTRQVRWSAYGILIALAIGNMSGRLLAVNSVSRMEVEKRSIQTRVRTLEAKLRERGYDEQEIATRVAEKLPKYQAQERRQRPFLSSNDRSRWLAIRALVDFGTFEIDQVIDRHIWNTIDMVQHRNRDGQLRLYSSKPPLLYTLLAGEYWLIQKTTGWTLADNPYAVGRLMLVTVNVLPLALFMAIVALLAERFGTTDWGRLFVVAAACLATPLTTFAVVLNNHTVGAVSAAVALLAVVRIWFDRRETVGWFALAGFAAAFTAANELPALALLAMTAAGLLLLNPRAWLRGFLPAAAIVAAAFFLTNYLAHDSLRPPYMHRSETDPQDNWYDYEYTVNGQQRESYWRRPTGVDRGEPSAGKYALHVLVGHHGIFSLTPIWLLAIGGAALWAWKDVDRLRILALAVLTLTVVCLTFYIGLRPQQDRNYGGVTSGFRWMFWFAPLWLVTMVPAADRLARTAWQRGIALTLLVVSVLSASYPTWNPWTVPWIEHWLIWLQS